MPSASAKLEKQASTESADPIKQGITIIEHKIRNLEKRKSRLESYRDQQSSGKELNSDQLAAIAKYDEVQQTLEFARELCKQFNVIAADTAKQQKKQARKEALEKAQQELTKVKEILLIQDVLTNMGQENVREDFLAGRNGAAKLSEEDLQHLDDLFTEVSPKRDVEEGSPPFAEQIQKAAEHLLFLVEGKNKEIIGTTYTQLKQKIHEINSCGYFDASSPSVTVDGGATEVTAVVPAEEEEVEPEGEEEEPESVPTSTFRSSKASIPMVPALNESNEQAPISAKVIIPVAQPPVSEVISSVMSAASSSFHFLQESELDSPEVITPTAPPPSALPIPSQTFTNQSFVPPPQSYQQQPQSLPQNQQTAPPQPIYAATIAIPTQQTSYVPYTSAPPPQPQHQSAYQQQQPPPLPQQVQQPPQQLQPAQPVERVSDWNDGNSAALDSSDWNVQCEAAAAESNTWQQHKSDGWAVNDSSGGQHHSTNDGFILSSGRGGSGRGGGRGRGGSRGAPRGGGGRNSTSGGGGGNNYFQSNGFQNRHMSGDHKRGGGGVGGPRTGPGGLRSDRGGPRGGSNRGGRGSNRQ